jgi:hypothetical protein
MTSVGEEGVGEARHQGGGEVVAAADLLARRSAILAPSRYAPSNWSRLRPSYAWNRPNLPHISSRSAQCAGGGRFGGLGLVNNGDVAGFNALYAVSTSPVISTP